MTLQVKTDELVAEYKQKMGELYSVQEARLRGSTAELEELYKGQIKQFENKA